MWLDSWGNVYDTREDAFNNVIERYVDDNDIIIELDYAIQEQELLEWIFQTPEVRKHFFQSYNHKIEQAKIACARMFIDEINEEDDN